MIILDLETTGLDPDKCCILEVAALRVDDNLEYAGQIEMLVLPTTDLSEMSLEVVRMHMDNGLLRNATDPTHAGTLAATERALLLWLSYSPAPRYLAGDSIHFDRSFLRVHMPRVHEALHHRMVDTSSFMVAHEMWGKPKAPKPEKPAHRALADCYVSLEKLKFYRGAP